MLIVGMTESGKTTLAHKLASEYKESGRKIIILDPIGGSRWATYGETTTSPKRFLRRVWATKSCAVFVDEASTVLSKADDDFTRLATISRHWGHRVHFIAQRYTAMPPVYRHQCSYLYLFASGRKDGEVLAEEWNCEELQNAHKLPKGTCYTLRRHGKVATVRVF